MRSVESVVIFAREFRGFLLWPLPFEPGPPLERRTEFFSGVGGSVSPYLTQFDSWCPFMI